MTQFKLTDQLNASKEVKKLELSQTAGRSVKLYNNFTKVYSSSFKR